MKKTRYKACLLISELDDEIILEAELTDVPIRRRSRHVMKRILVIAACVTMLTVTIMSVFLLAMLSDPGANVEPPTESESTVSLLPEANWVADYSLVRVERLSIVNQPISATSDKTLLDASVSADSAKVHLGQKLILLHFTCRKDEQILVTPSNAGAVRMIESREYEENGRVWSNWVILEEGEEHYLYATESLHCRDDADKLGQSVVVKNGDVLLWQYSNDAAPCIADNYVDLTVSDRNGNITGGGSVYIGGYDLTDISENKTYYGASRYNAMGDNRPNFVNTNAIYRPAVIEAFRYTEEVEPDAHNELIATLHDKATTLREKLFFDLSEDNFRISLRKVLYDYNDLKNAISYQFRVIHHDVARDDYVFMYLEAGETLLFLYHGTYQPVREWRIDTADQYGYMITGQLLLKDGTVVNIDINQPNCMYEVIPPD